MEFEKYKIAHDLPEIELVTWTFHDKPTPGVKTIRMTSVSILIPTGEVFTGISGCSESDTFNKKEGFNRAYGKATQKLAHFMRGKIGADFLIKDMGCATNQEISRWVTNHAFNAKIDFLNKVYQDRLALGKIYED